MAGHVLSEPTSLLSFAELQQALASASLTQSNSVDAINPVIFTVVACPSCRSRVDVSLVSGRYTAARFGPQAVRHCIQDFFGFLWGEAKVGCCRRISAPLSNATDAIEEDTDERNALNRKNNSPIKMPSASWV